MELRILSKEFRFTDVDFSTSNMVEGEIDFSGFEGSIDRVAVVLQGFHLEYKDGDDYSVNRIEARVSHDPPQGAKVKVRLFVQLRDWEEKIYWENGLPIERKTWIFPDGSKSWVRVVAIAMMA
jgi:hypothetical protein